MDSAAPEGVARSNVTITGRQLGRPFELAEGTLRSIHLIRVEIQQDDVVGVGEVSASDAFGFSPTVVKQDIEKLLGTALTASPAPTSPHVWMERAAGLPKSVIAPARLATEMAFLDLASRLARCPLPDLLKLPRLSDVPIVHTVPINAAFPKVEGPLKIKLGGARDADVLRALIRDRPSRGLILDFNNNWSEDTWVEQLPELASLSPDVLEDPTLDSRLVQRIRLALPRSQVFFDDGTSTMSDVRRLAGEGLGSNVKLMRFGGLFPAVEALLEAKAQSAPSMLGCYLEPTRAIAYAAQIAHLADWVDLDGHFWLAGSEQLPKLTLAADQPGIPQLVQ